MQEILPLVLNGGDLTPIQTIPNWDRVPWLEEKRLAVVVDRLTSPRAMVTHFPYHLMPPSFHASKAKVNNLLSVVTMYCQRSSRLPCFCDKSVSSCSVVCNWQVIYVMRNPKDVMVSSYYFHQMAGFLKDPGTFDEFMDTFLEGKGQRLLRICMLIAFLGQGHVCHYCQCQGSCWLHLCCLCCPQCCLENGQTTWRAGGTQSWEIE